MLRSEQEVKAALAIKAVLDKSIEGGPWQANLFLKGIKKKLEELRDSFQKELGLDQANEQDIPSLLDSGNSGKEIEVYISLYQSQGNNIHKWQEAVTSLANYTMGRPIYKDERDVQSAIQLSDRNPNNAYVVVTVNSDAIVPDPAEQSRLDREGRKLIALREGSVFLKNVVRLVHASGQYKFIRNYLVKQA